MWNVSLNQSFAFKKTVVMYTIGNVKIKGIAFTKLRKLEVYKLYKDVVKVISEFNTKAMHIENTCDVLLGMQPKADLLLSTEKDFGPHPLTPKIESLHQKRFKFAAIITTQMRTLEKADLEENRDLVTLAKSMVYRNLNYLRQNDQITVEELINQFFHQLKINPAVKDALVQLGFKPYLDELESANNAYKKIYLERTAQQSRRHKGSTLPIQRELQYVLGILFDQVDYYQHVYEEVDYSVLNTKLNYVITTYTKLIKTRDTQRKNRKMREQEDEQVVLVEEIKMQEGERKQSEAIGGSPESNVSSDVKEEQSIKPANEAKNNEGKGKPINGLLDILKKLDEGKEHDDEDDYPDD